MGVEKFFAEVCSTAPGRAALCTVAALASMLLYNQLVQQNGNGIDLEVIPESEDESSEEESGSDGEEEQLKEGKGGQQKAVISRIEADH